MTAKHGARCYDIYCTILCHVRQIERNKAVFRDLHCVSKMLLSKQISLNHVVLSSYYLHITTVCNTKVSQISCYHVCSLHVLGCHTLNIVRLLFVRCCFCKFCHEFSNIWEQSCWVGCCIWYSDSLLFDGMFLVTLHVNSSTWSRGEVLDVNQEWLLHTFTCCPCDPFDMCDIPVNYFLVSSAISNTSQFYMFVRTVYY
jgi:hypothetical protein